jgi:hypothetical protein
MISLQLAPCCVSALQVTLNPQCTIRVEVLANSTSGGSLFIVQGLAVIPFTHAPVLTPVERRLLQTKA